MGRGRVTLLQRLMEERHLTHADTIRLLERRARQMGAADFTLGERTLDHWLSGALRTAPQPVRRRVLEAEFGHSVSDLLSLIDGDRPPVRAGDTSAGNGGGPSAGPSAGPSSGPSAAAEAVAEMLAGTVAGTEVAEDPAAAVSAAAARSARFGQRADGNALTELALEQLRLRLRQLSAGYVHTPIWPVFTELTALRDEVFDLLEAPDPRWATDLYVIAGTTCAMLAHASGNLGFLDEAALQAHTALICARRVGHGPLAAWALGVRALQAEWNGRAVDALGHLERAGLELARDSRAGTMPVWLAAIEARAQASLGRRREAMAALGRVERAAPVGSNDLDAIGGILTFPEPKRVFYTASALRRLGQLRVAESGALDAIAEYARGPAEQRSYGDEALAWLEVAIARAGRGELDGAVSAIERVQHMPPERHLAWLLRPLRELGRSVSTVRLHSAVAATGIREAVELLSTSIRRQVSDAGA
jgi:hypothetical protein